MSGLIERIEHDRAPAVDAATWDALLPGGAAGFYLCHAWLTGQRGAKGYADRTWTARDSSGLVAAVPAYTTQRPLDLPGYDLHRLFGDGTDPATWAPQLLIGSRAGYANAPMIRPGAGTAVWVDLVRSVLAAQPHASAAIAYLDEAVARELAGPLGGPPVLKTGARCEIAVQGNDFEDYLGTRSRGCRRRVRADVRAFAASGAVIETSRLTVEQVPVLAPLLANVQAHHGAPVAVENIAGFLRSCTEHGLAERSVLFTCRRGPDVLGFCLAFEHDRTLTVRVVGLDYARIGQHAEYFTLLVHEPVRYALAHGLTTVDLGKSGYRAKLLRGAELTPLCTLLLAAPRMPDADAVDAANAAAERALRELLPRPE